MKKFARFLLIWIIISILGGVIGYFWLNNEISQVYYSTTQIYVIPGEISEASLRASDGGLKEDFAIIFKSEDVISNAQKSAGTTEDLTSYVTVNTPANSNIIEIICNNPDQTTAKKYADAIAKSALKTTTIIPVEKMSILSEGTSSNIAYRPNLYRYTVYLAVASSFSCFLIELIIVLFISSFKRNREEDDEADYNRYYGNIVTYNENSKSYPNKEAIKAKKEAAASLETGSGYDDDLDDDLLLDESESIDVDILTDNETDEKLDTGNIKSSSEVIGRIPR